MSKKKNSKPLEDLNRETFFLIFLSQTLQVDITDRKDAQNKITRIYKKKERKNWKASKSVRFNQTSDENLHRKFFTRYSRGWCKNI